jgi:hypothetical protein
MSADGVGGRNPCNDTEASLAELALGILPGDERVQVLAHLDGCEHCLVEAERLTATADSLLHLASEIEPPLGLEVRLFQRQGVRAWLKGHDWLTSKPSAQDFQTIFDQFGPTV